MSLAVNPKKPRLGGVVFDMDGTLTVPNIDFHQLYRDCGVHPSQDILREVERMPSEQAVKAQRIIDETEERGRATMELLPGAMELTQWLQQQSIPMALVTRNTVATTQTFRTLCRADFDIIIARDSPFPPKPDPAALQHIQAVWQQSSTNLVMIGDSVDNDIAFGQAAGTHTILLGTTASSLPDVAVEQLTDIRPYLQSKFEIGSK